MNHIPSQARQRPRGGFTLIELLVVISIIGLLVALLLPALATARDAANLQLCGTRVRQVATAGFLYAEDNKGYSPDRGYNLDLQANGYMQGDVGLYCPIIVGSSSSWVALRKPGWLYTVNVMLSEAGFPSGSSTSVKLDVVAAPGFAMFFSDGHNRGQSYAHWNDYTDGQVYGRTDAAWAIAPHPGSTQGGVNGYPTTRGFNVAYLDGHVSYITFRGDANLTAVRANRAYPFNFKVYWGWNAPGGTSDAGWDRAPFTGAP